MTRINRIKNQFAVGDGACDPHDTAPRHERVHKRLAVSATVFVIPVQSDGRPDERQRLMGRLQTISLEGVTLNLEAPRGPLPGELMMGLQVESGPTQYAGIEVLTSVSQDQGRLIVHGLFGSSVAEILQPRNLTPRFHFDSMTFTLGLPASLIHSWAAAGVLQPVVIDRLWLCPVCHGLPTFRSGCRQCGSGRVIKDWPGYVAVDAPGLVASCAGEPNTVGSGPRTLSHPANSSSAISSYRCQDCHWSGSELAPVNQCLHCEHRFSAQQAYELVLQGYSAERLDPIDFCQSL
jgi:hypothetical protein